MKISLLVAFGAGCEATELQTSASASANPIRRVVTLIQGLQKKVEAEAVAEQKLFDEFMCYCKTGVGTLEESISAAEAKIPKVTAAIEAAEAGVKQLRADLKQHKADRASAEESSEKATAIREKEAAAYAAFKSESETNIAAIKKAIGALAGGAAGSFLQTGGAQTLSRFVVDKAELADVDRDTVMAFLQGGDAEASSGQIDGILKQMLDTMVAELKDATGEEDGAIKNYDGLIAANTKQIDAATVAIEEKSVRVGEVDVQTAEMKGDLKDTEKALSDDKKFLADLQKNCGTKEAEWAEIKKMRGEEIIALADTIKILNDDDALEMFKKTLPGSASSFLQVSMTTASERKRRALSMIRDTERSVKPAHRHLDFIALALSGKKIGLEKVIKMCDDLVAVLKKEQEDDDAKKAYCEKEIDTAEDKKKVLEQAISDSEKAIEDAEETIATGDSEIKALEQGIKDLDKSVDEATEQRKEENAEFKELMANNGAAKELIGMAKNRMNKFYNPSQYKPPPKRELSEEDRAAQAAGEFVSISEHSQEDVAPPPPPSGPNAYSKKSEESNGVIRMLDMLVQDLDKEMQVAEVDEKNAQEEYEQMMADSSAKRKESKKMISDTKGAKADAEEALQSHTDTKDKKLKENMANDKVLSSLHAECDWLLQYFDVRKEARTSEIEAIGKAKAVLNGADFSLLQTARSLRGRHY